MRLAGILAVLLLTESGICLVITYLETKKNLECFRRSLVALKLYISPGDLQSRPAQGF